MGDIGGTLGLFIGLSVCTALEFFEYILDVTILILTKPCRNKKRPNKVDDVSRLPPNYGIDTTWEQDTMM